MNPSENHPWGSMTGIRPVKRVREFMDEGKCNDEIESIFKTNYGVSDEKIKIALSIAKKERELVKDIPKNSISLYIGIPFCPSKCVYCSFMSMAAKQMAPFVEPYLNALYREIDATKKIIEDLGLTIETVYIGGGTPTTLIALELDNLLYKLFQTFDLSKVKEFTIEAGRPDTITKPKLDVMRKYGISRISINPQTMNQRTLELIGRKHSTEQITEAYQLARDCGFDTINMDVIAGLPEESLEDFQYTLDSVCTLSPENITVHTLYIKRASEFNRSQNFLPRTEGEVVSQMIAYSYEKMAKEGYEPYYLYRQKNILGDQENTGFGKPGHEGLYNIFMMEEIQSIFSLGVGGVTKLVKGSRIERIFNFKDVVEYLKRFDEIIERKKFIYQFLGGYEHEMPIL